MGKTENHKKAQHPKKAPWPELVAIKHDRLELSLAHEVATVGHGTQSLLSTVVMRRSGKERCASLRPMIAAFSGKPKGEFEFFPPAVSIVVPKSRILQLDRVSGDDSAAAAAIAGEDLAHLAAMALAFFDPERHQEILDLAESYREDLLGELKDLGVRPVSEEQRKELVRKHVKRQAAKRRAPAAGAAPGCRPARGMRAGLAAGAREG